MNNMENSVQANIPLEEFAAKRSNGLLALMLNTLLCLVGLGLFIWGAVLLDADASAAMGVLLMTLGGLYAFLVGPILFAGVKVIKPGEAMVLTLFGKYSGTLKGEGIYYVNPFSAAVGAPVKGVAGDSLIQMAPQKGKEGEVSSAQVVKKSRKISLKAMTLDNGIQKINDQMGNPINIGIVVIWRVTNTAKAVFSVDNYLDFLSIQCDSSLRNIVRLYPYDSSDDDGANEKSLRGSSVEIAENLKTAIQEKVNLAGLEILEARITHLAYAQEIAAAMLQRQQARAIVDARQLIVDGAVGMVEMALDKLKEHEVVELDEERKAAMVSNLLVVLCGNKDPQPVVNSGSIY